MIIPKIRIMIIAIIMLNIDLLRGHTILTSLHQLDYSFI